MNKTTLALVLGTGLTLGLVTPSAQGAATNAATTEKLIQTLNTAELSAGQFNGLFTQYNNAILSPFRFDGTPGESGLIQSQVFKGTGAAEGLFAYAYQVTVNDMKDDGGEQVHVDSTSFKFNATPMTTNFAGPDAQAYVVKDAQLGGLNLAGSKAPTTLSWQPGQTTGVVRAQYVDPASQTTALDSAANGATFVLISSQLPSDAKPSVNVGGAAATTTIPVAYSTQTGTFEPIPVPEPATILAWSGMVAAVALVRRVRKARLAAV
ncbi:MAG: hypothetical protein AB7I30_18365 [Isosphaeraceae bacterium]